METTCDRCGTPVKQETEPDAEGFALCDGCVEELAERNSASSPLPHGRRRRRARHRGNGRQKRPTVRRSAPLVVGMDGTCRETL